ncbi:MAG: dihydropteroate synthase [Candidatus Helarchaeota archaeon]
MKINTTISGINVGDDSKVKILGVINLSTESFYKQSVSTNLEDVVEKVDKFVEAGADFIDIGARSTAPGVKPIPVKDELNQLIPSLKTIIKNFDIPISVDTQYSLIADNALNIGATIINDVSGFRTDPNIMNVIVNHNADTIIMASKKVPGDCLEINTIITELKDSISDIEDLGLDPGKIIIDPGIGRWIPEKTFWYNLVIIDKLKEFRILNKPILVGISRKSFIGDILNYPDPVDRLNGSLACTSIAVYNGAHLIRAHDIKETRDVVDIVFELKKSRLSIE